MFATVGILAHRVAHLDAHGELPSVRYTWKSGSETPKSIARAFRHASRLPTAAVIAAV
jgi:hypothetical protein